jgi:diaminopimelate decarboxylase
VDETPWFGVNISIKANGNPELLKIIREEGCNGDAVSPGEIFLLEKAGFEPAQIIFVINNVSPEEMQYALDRNVLVSVDSLSQLETLGRLNRGGHVCLRFNPGAGAGHHEKVHLTAGTQNKFGIQKNMIDQAKANPPINTGDAHLWVLNQHIGSLFMDIKHSPI